MSVSRAPAGSGPAGKRLWAGVLGRYDLEAHELELLRRACRCADVLEAIERDALASGGTFLPGSDAAKEWRLTCIVQARLLAGLRLPAETGQRPQSRPLRGVYSGAVGI